MASIRRTFGGFVVAAATAAALVAMPAPVYAKNGNSSGSGSGVCDTINSTIAYITSTYDGDLEALLLAPWLLVADLYHCE